MSKFDCVLRLLLGGAGRTVRVTRTDVAQSRCKCQDATTRKRAKGRAAGAQRRATHRPLELVARVLPLALDLDGRAVGDNLLHGHAGELVEGVELLPHQALFVKVGVDDLPRGVVPPLVIAGDVAVVVGCSGEGEG